MQGAQAQSLAGELKSHMPYGTAKKLGEKKKKTQTNNLVSQFTRRDLLVLLIQQGNLCKLSSASQIL